MKNEYEIQRKMPSPLPIKGSCNSQDFAHDNICKTHQCENYYGNANFRIESCLIMWFYYK
jgi:hypothetical protein